MITKLKKIINSSIAISCLLIILGIVLILFPKTSLSVLAYIISALLIINGIYLIVLEISLRSKWIPIDTMLAGILSILFGSIMLIYPEMLRILVPVALGTWFILTSIFKIRLACTLKNIEGAPWILTLIMAILAIICGFILIIDPIRSSITLTLFAGIMMIIYSISDIIDMIVFKKHLNKLVKYFKSNIKIIDE
ncbi:MAG: DUF308 domain-containing protein [Erysipelotrichaceae bacterium]|nr:DUF308 domain-containing protein [Erysipelotrichaceae bacterium]